MGTSRDSPIADGCLTIDALGAANTKLNFADVSGF
jgi:hypothetical protein